MNNNKYENQTTTGVKLKDLKAPLQEEALELDRSLHWLIKSILRNHVEERKKKKLLLNKK